ncbi:glycine zipper family protein [uncultured Porticoccus sp.]|uniref:glycine zipper family protein n=1 Tax=uncultured Porticoccus sp. TaxID=1256050 RepID=UPI0026181773|nr:glycine zipper family protein [uncultured Porticoccus sp.]
MTLENRTLMLRLPLILLLSVIAAGCSSQRQSGYGASDGIIIDTQGVDMSYYRADLDNCQRYAAEVPVAERTATSAAGGAVVGGVVGAIVGDSGTAKKGAGVGAVTGAIKGVSSGSAERKRVVKNCLRGRGYRVLN